MIETDRLISTDPESPQEEAFEPAMRPKPLGDASGIGARLEFYRAEELTRMVQRSAGLLEIEVIAEGAREIAGRARATPRIANRLLRRVRDFAQVKAQGRVTREVADAA